MRSPRPGAVRRSPASSLVGLAALPFLGAGAAAVVQGPRPPRPVGRHAEHVAARDAPHHDARDAASCGRSPASRDVGAHVGRAITADQVVGSGSGEMWVTMRLGGRLRRDARRRAARSPAATRACAAASYLRERPDARRADAGADDGLTGPRLRPGPRCPAIARRERSRDGLAGVDGVHDAARPAAAGAADAARSRSTSTRRGRHGIKPGDVRRAAATLVHGHRGRQLLRAAEGLRGRRPRRPDVRAEPRQRPRPAASTRPAAATCRLGDVADVGVQPEPGRHPARRRSRATSTSAPP